MSGTRHFFGPKIMFNKFSFCVQNDEDMFTAISKSLATNGHQRASYEFWHLENEEVVNISEQTHLGQGNVLVLLDAMSSNKHRKNVHSQ